MSPNSCNGDLLTYTKWPPSHKNRNQEKGCRECSAVADTLVFCVLVPNWRLLELRWTDRSDYSYWIHWRDGAMVQVFLLCICDLSEPILNVNREERELNNKYLLLYTSNNCITVVWNLHSTSKLFISFCVDEYWLGTLSYTNIYEYCWHLCMHCGPPHGPTEN